MTKEDERQLRSSVAGFECDDSVFFVWAKLVSVLVLAPLASLPINHRLILRVANVPDS